MLAKGARLFCNRLLLGWLVKNVENWFNLRHYSHKLKHGRPMFEYKVHKKLFDFLRFEENSKMHWIDLVG